MKDECISNQEAEPFPRNSSHTAVDDSYSDSEARVLMNAVSHGDHAAFERLYRMTCKRVTAYLCRLLSDKQEVEDLLTETYIEIWRSAGKFKYESLVLTWIIGIARNMAMNWLKRRKMHRDLSEIPEIATEDSSVNAIEANDRALLVHKALMSLTDQHREALALALLKGFSYEVIANMLELPVNTVKTRVFYGKKALLEYFDKAGVGRNEV
jgi:RNA polymerase sigma-70 factor, ECF subfamily